MPRRKKTETKSPKAIVVRRFTEEEILAENKRRQIMWVSVSFAMMLIVIVWVANVKKIVSVSAMNIGSVLMFDDFKNNFSQSFKAVNSGLAEIKKETGATTSDGNLLASTTDENFNTNMEEINRELGQIINNASSTINNK